MLLERGIVVSYETLAGGGKRHGSGYVAQHCAGSRRSKDDIWHLDEVVVRINGENCWLWRAVDQGGYVLDEIVQTRRNTKAARRLLGWLLKKQGMFAEAHRHRQADNPMVRPQGVSSCRMSSIARTRA